MPTAPLHSHRRIQYFPRTVTGIHSRRARWELSWRVVELSWRVVMSPPTGDNNAADLESSSSKPWVSA
jgi:hypothetical protein